MNNLKKLGFTLIEILISLSLILLSFLIIYRIVFTVQKNVKDLEKEIKNKELLFNFLYSFKSEINGIIDFHNLKLDKKEIVFSTFIQDIEFPVEITYTVKVNEEETLIRKQKNIFSGYTYSFPVLKCQSINFLFFQEEKWNYIAETDKTIKGIAIELNYSGEEIFYPVLLNIIEEKNEEKK
ncbi:MAG: prepilin-type N-terminal cleavage/methylation domain-containing protein [Candidatus Omnitrophica bacterium]|nr:prepilin-type N-terminal cleavage/methylation domain-containing protein [Candidatus Omnitrophota bacterium]MCM8801877.1 prepilin-type N-terminal cleavage/methylation domain-containing protein [Candidatus Omnitrophota bacterium]